MRPQTKYAKSGDAYIAYQVVAEGPLDLLFVAPVASHLDFFWEEPLVAGFLRRLASFSRLILFDKRGTGLSDRVSGSALPSLEQRMDDVRAVMDAAGSKSAALLGASEGGTTCALFAATYPERTTALVLFSTYPRAIQDEDFPEGWLPAGQVDAYVSKLLRQWFEGEFDFYADDPLQLRAREWYQRMLRAATSPGAAVALLRMGTDMDIRDVLPAIRVPTLVLVRAGDENLPACRFMAEKIPDARLVVLPGAAHSPFFGEQESALLEIEHFLTGVRPTPQPDRTLATVLFTDIVGSTERVAELGDRGWGDLVDRHNALVRRELARFQGREIDTAGDGFLALFDGPGRAIHCAAAISQAVRALGIEIRAGIHTGECEFVEGKARGIAVHIASRVAGLAGRSEVLVSHTVKDLVIGSGIRFEERGSHALGGVPGDWRVFSVQLRSTE
jgi:pimeloyl-ACP methyl ester carboxylesterase